MNKTDLSSVTEEQLLLRQLREGDMGSYETLFHRYYPTFFAFARGMLKDAGAAEDIIQNVFMKIWIHREALDETMSIKNYIYVLSKREVFNYLRAKYNTHVVLTEDMMTLEQSSSTDEPTTDYRELREAVQKAIADSGIKKTYLADKLNLTRQGLDKMLNKKQFTLDDANKILNLLNMSVTAIINE